MKIKIIVLLFLCCSTLSFATQDSEQALKIIGISSDLSLLALDSSGSNAAGNLRSILIKSLKNGRIVKEFKVTDIAIGRLFDRRIYGRALAYLRRKGITGKNLRRAFTSLRLSSFKLCRIPGKGVLRLESLTYGDVVLLTFFDSQKKDYRLLFKKDYNIRRNLKFLDKSTPYKKKMQNFNIRNYIKSVYLNRNNKQSLLLILGNKYNMFGSDDSERLLQIDLNTNIKDYLWLNVFGYRLYQKKLYKEAVQKFKASIKAKPTHYVAYYNLACTYALLKNTTGSITYLKKLLYFWKIKKQRNARYYLKRIKNDRDFDAIRRKTVFIRFTQRL